MLAIIGGRPQRFAGHVDLYHRALEQFGHPAQPIGQHSLGLVADTDEEAVETWWRYWQPVVAALAAERGFYSPTARRYEAEIDHGALFVGSPETVARKIATVARDLRLSRFDLKYDIMRLPRAGPRPHASSCSAVRSPRGCGNCSRRSPPMSDLDVRPRHVRRRAARTTPARSSPTPRRSGRSSTRRCSPTQLGVDVIALGEHHRPGVLDLDPGDRARRHRHPHLAHPARLRRDRAELRRPGPGVPALRHRGRAVATAGPRSSSGAARSPSRSRCSATTCATTTCCSRRRSTCSSSCSTRSRSPGAAPCAPRSRTPTSSRRPSPGT